MNFFSILRLTPSKSMTRERLPMDQNFLWWRKRRKFDFASVIVFLDNGRLWGKNYDDDRDIYSNDDVPDHDYRFEDGSHPSRLMGDPADGYRIENEAPAMTVTMKKIFIKAMDCCRAAPISPRREWALVGSRITPPRYMWLIINQC